MKQQKQDHLPSNLHNQHCQTITATTLAAITAFVYLVTQLSRKRRDISE